MPGQPTHHFEDDNLVAAISNAHVWPDVYEALLGTRRLGARTRSRILSRAAAIGVSVDHLEHGRPGPRPRWSDQDLVSAVGSARSWAEVGRLLGTSGGERLKPHAARLSLDVTHLDQADHMRAPDAEPVNSGSVDVLALRVAAESLATAWYTLRRGVVFQAPPGAAHVDLLVEREGRLVRVQVKSSSHHRGSGWVLRTVCFQGEGRSVSRPYRNGEIDEVFAVTSTGRMFVLPAEVVVGRRAVTLGPKYEKYEVTLF